MKVFKSEKARRALLEDYDRLLGAWGVPYEEFDVAGEHGVTHVIAAGDVSAPPLLLLHGVGDNSAVMWLYNIGALTAKYRCYAVDTIGGPGKSVPGSGYGKGFDQSAWLIGVLDGLGVDDCFAAGVSNGAVMAFALAERTERIKKLVCIEGGLVLNEKAGLSTMLKAFPEALLPTDGNVIKLMKKFACPREGFFEDCPEVTRHMILIMRAHNQMAMRWHSPKTYDPTLAAALRERALFLLGEYSGASSNRYTDVLAHEGFAWKVINNAGHGANMEQPETVNAYMTEFLR